ncbi:unnamed protein product [Arabidopsis thaliana]|uniref:(thale cress) hypothetical protein n=1 Tax=Arabidopsis thaliana TaxID=3702 RepID=A0A7G2EEE9_ARATH|nr:unnamed protein product [Arabidopsis thaliana]
MVAQGFTVDLKKPLVFQVGHLGEDYEEWVHQPIATKEGPRFFQSDFWEFLTLTVWWAVPVIWLPVVVWCISRSVSMGCSLPEIVPIVVMGIFIWTFFEYVLHRFVFHIKTKSYWGNTAHYLIHGCHHKHPMDHLRLVFPPTATAILCFPFWNIAKAISTPSTAPALFGGGMLGYVMYDVTHYYLHHAQPTRPVTKNLKKYHLNHHFRIQDKGFGSPPHSHGVEFSIYVRFYSIIGIIFQAMATANAPPELASGNPCCLAWQGKYIGMKKRRDAFKEGVTLLQKAIENVNAEKSNLERKLGEKATDGDMKANGSTVKASLEKEISGLKFEIVSLQQKLERNLKEKSEETKLLQDQASSREKEINELKDLLKKETLRADSSEEEREHVFKELNKAKALIVKDEEIKPDIPEVKREISLVKNLLASERQKTESERKKAESEKKKADMYLSELEVLRNAAHKTSSDLLTLTSNLETVKKQLELEKQKTLKEKKRADMESAKARDQMKLAEDLSKKFEIVRARNEELKKEMESQSASSKVKFAENAEKLEEKIRLFEMNKKTAMDWKSRADELTQQLQKAQLVTEGLKKQIHELSLSQKSIKTHSISPQKVRDLKKAEMRLLKKKLKFERNCAKHSKTVATFEKFRREFQGAELGRLKLEFGSLTNRMNLLDEYFSTDVEGTAGLGKATGCRKLQTLQSEKNRNGEKHSDARCNLVASSVSRSQGREQFSVTTSAEIANDKPNIQPTKSSMVQKISDTSKNGNLCLVAENYLQRCQRDSHENSRKRKRMLEAVVSHKHLSSADKKKNLPIGEKMGTLESVVGSGSRPSEKEETLVPDRQGGSSAIDITVSKKRRVSCKKKTILQQSLESNQSGKTPGNIAGKTMCVSTAKGHDVTTLSPEDFATTDYMKLLELDNLEEEKYYQMARESLLSPDLPQVDFLGGEIGNEDKNPARALDMAASNSMYFRETILSSESPSLNTLDDLVTVKMPPMLTPLHGHILEHIVVFSNIGDQKSIIKIFHATNNCVQRCPSVSREQWAVPAILSSLKMEENLLSQERVCVFLSLLLHNFSMVPSMNTLNFDSFSCLDSFSKHIYGVMADTEAGVILSEFSEELLSLLQDLLSEQRVLFSVKSSETSESDLSMPVTLGGENVALVNKIALIDHLVAGSAILAAICTALDRIGYICEASFEILHKYSREKTSVLLTILHVIAYIAGGKMVLSSEHDISIAVLKSIVMFLEYKHFGTVEGNSQLHPGKNKCPFSDRSSSLEAMASKLMEILQEFTQSSTLHQSLTSSSHIEKTEFRPAHKDFQCVLTRDESLNLCDILSLVELIACYTAWDWTSANIVAPLLKMLGLSLPMNLSVAIISLLGQLSSIGVEAGGYSNEGISNLRVKLSTVLQCETTLKAGFAVQIATVNSLLKTMQLKFPIDFQDKTTMIPGSGDQSLSGSVNVVTKWLSLLSKEQRVFAFEFLQTNVVR